MSQGSPDTRAPHQATMRERVEEPAGGVVCCLGSASLGDVGPVPTFFLPEGFLTTAGHMRDDAPPRTSPSDASSGRDIAAVQVEA